MLLLQSLILAPYFTESMGKLELIQRRTNNLVKGLETTTCAERLKELRVFTLEKTHFKRKYDSILKTLKRTVSYKRD